MGRLVDADELKTAFPCGETVRTESVRATIDYMATMVDAVEVVRCKDCFYRDGNACDFSAVYVRPNGYCQWGKRILFKTELCNGERREER